MLLLALPAQARGGHFHAFFGGGSSYSGNSAHYDSITHDPGGSVSAALQGVRASPADARSWFALALSQSQAGNNAAARDALAHADRLAPGLHFADAATVAALRARLATSAVSFHGAGLCLGVFALLALIIRPMWRWVIGGKSAYR